MDSLKNKDLKTAIKRVNHLATELYDLMENGMTIDFALPEMEALTGRRFKPNRLIVTKPGTHLELQTNSKKISGRPLMRRPRRKK